jgi:hypothetical protein
MIAELLKAAKIPAKESRYADPPETTYAVYFDDIETDGPDGLNRIIYHNWTVELYEPRKDTRAEKSFEDQLDAEGIYYTKSSRTWVSAIQRYQVIYEFTHIEKRRINHG